MKVVNTIPESPFVDSAIASNWSIDTTWFVVNGKPERNEAGHLNCTATDAFNTASTLHETIMDCDIWVIHRFYPQFSELLLKAVRNMIKVYIQTWGPDYLPYESRPNLYLPRTSAALHQVKSNRGKTWFEIPTADSTGSSKTKCTARHTHPPRASCSSHQSNYSNSPPITRTWEK